ncbi:MAG TPA: hypothetical protein VG870_03015 [Chitinophagaceae bacterium]|nr:hypothetical protein [Chitinophagaceae bacterium]
MPMRLAFPPIRSWVFLLLCLAGGCKEKKVSLAGNQPVRVSDFLASFDRVKPPFQVTDSLLEQPVSDSLLISYKVFTQFVPDSVLARDLGKGVRPRIYPVARAVSEKQETYVIARLQAGDRKIFYLACFDGHNHFLASMPLLRLDQLASTSQVSSLDRSFTLFKTIRRRNADGTLSEGKDVYVLNPEGRSFQLILTDALDEKPTELINPIDTLPRKSRFAADYVSGKRNLISVRDGLRPGRIVFFIHFEQDKGVCTGELKGEASLVSPNKAVYRSSGDPCVLELSFTPTTASMKELEGCGSHRDLRCVFSGTFTRKKEVKKKKVGKK